MLSHNGCWPIGLFYRHFLSSCLETDDCYHAVILDGKQAHEDAFTPAHSLLNVLQSSFLQGRQP